MSRATTLSHDLMNWGRTSVCFWRRSFFWKGRSTCKRSMTDVRRARHRTEAAREVIWSWRLSARSHRSVIHVNQRPTWVTSAKQTRPVTSSREFWTSSLVLWRQRPTSRMLLSVVLRCLSDKFTMIVSSASLQTGTEADSGVKFLSQGSQSQRKTVEETIVSTRATWHREGRRKSRRVQKSRLSHRVKRPLTELKRCWADQGDLCLTRWSWITLLLYDETIPSVCIIHSWRLESFFAKLHDTDYWHVFTSEADRVDTGVCPMSDWILKVCPRSEDSFLRICGEMRQLYASKMLHRLTQGLSCSRGDSGVSYTTIRVVSVQSMEIRKASRET